LENQAVLDYRINAKKNIEKINFFIALNNLKLINFTCNKKLYDERHNSSRWVRHPSLPFD